MESLLVYFQTGDVGDILHTLCFHFVGVPLGITFFFFFFGQTISFSFLLSKFVLLLSHPSVRIKNQ